MSSTTLSLFAFSAALLIICCVKESSAQGCEPPHCLRGCPSERIDFITHIDGCQICVCRNNGNCPSIDCACPIDYFQMNYTTVGYCPYCDCQKCQSPECDCPGEVIYTTDSNGCRQCECVITTTISPPTCPPLVCPTSCPRGLDYSIGPDGCRRCTCAACPPFQCPSTCPNGYKYEYIIGCPSCTCACPTRLCPPSCPNGYKTETDINGCEICICDTNCPPVVCPTFCPDNLFVNTTDSAGCTVCECRTCPPIICPAGCPSGIIFKTVDGCQVCECRASSSCPPVVCPTFCPNNLFVNRTDSAGCTVCECRCSPLSCPTNCDLGVITRTVDGCQVCECNTVKPGRCAVPPPPNPPPCNQGCSDDTECPGTQKCCGRCPKFCMNAVNIP